MIRFFDFMFAVLGLIVLAVPIALVWLAIPLFSAGPALFRQVRVGRNQIPFTCYKFRTMHVGTSNVASHEVGVAAITGIGRILRRTKLDELPQLWNVARGDMSFVGPRPCLPTQLELISEREKRNLHSIRPGITGPAQVRGIDMSDPPRLAALDERWLLAPSLPAYFRYIFQTVTGAGSGDAAVQSSR